jgi:uncharacterized LabA/DUF88 family protein
MIFIDSPNILMGAKALGVNRLKYEVLVNELRKGTELVGSRLYGSDKQTLEGFYAQLEKKGIRVERVAPSKSVDGRLMMQMLIGAYRGDFDIAILASGDRDYLTVIEELKRIDKQVWVAAFNHTTSPALMTMANRFIPLDDLLQIFKAADGLPFPNPNTH